MFELLEKAEKMIESANRGVDAPPALILLDGFSVCPQSLVNGEATELLRLQAQCEKYHAAPFASIWMKNPNNVLESFESIESGSATAFRHNMSEAERKSSGAGASGKKTYPIGPGKWGQMAQK